jgi:bacteriocin biosynthesis cyclodehydratase domain-containing protein
MRWKVRSSVFVSNRGDEFRFYFTSTRRTKAYELNALAQRLLRLLDGTRDTAAIVAALRKGRGFRNEADVHETLEFLRREGIAEVEGEAPPAGWFGSDELRRYERQIEFWADFADGARGKFEFQKTLKDKRAVVVGLGGSGSWTAYGLLMAGVGRLRLVDHDRVALSNLSRQALYDEGDVGRPKLDAFAAKARAMNSAVEIETVSLRVDERTDLSPVCDGGDVVLSLADAPTADAVAGWVSAPCMARGIPHIVGGGYRLHVGVLGTTVLPFETACWECWRIHLERPENADHRKWNASLHEGVERLSAGSLGATSAIVGQFHAFEALKILTGISPPSTCDTRVELDFLTLDVKRDRFPRQAACPACGEEAAKAVGAARAEA